MSEETKAYDRANERVEAKIGFFIHLAVYLSVNLLLIIINLSTSSRYLWFKWPLIGWGIGLLCHAIGVFFKLAGWPAVKEHMIEKEMQKEKASGRDRSS
jgi:hypothetical protein